MAWFNKFKVGQEVKVVRKVSQWHYGFGVSWSEGGYMDKTIGRVYTIIKIDKAMGFLLSTGTEVNQDFWYPVESLVCVKVKGKQLLFNFME